MLDYYHQYSPFGQATVSADNMFAPCRQTAYGQRDPRQVHRQREVQQQMEIRRQQEAQMQRQNELQRQAALERQRQYQATLRGRQSQRLDQTVTVREVENDQVFQFQFSKEFGSFNSYEIRVVKKGGNTYLKITSEVDSFFKLYQVDTKQLDIKNIDWKSAMEGRLLVVNIPKRKQESEEKMLLRYAKSQQRLQRKQQKKAQKEAETSPEYESEAEPSESNSASDTDSSALESGSDSEQHTPNVQRSSFSVSSPIKPKKTRKLSIEDVEDEESIFYRKQLASPIPRSIIE